MMSADLEVKKGIKISAEEAAHLDPEQIATLLPHTPAQEEVEGQAFFALIHCPYCGAFGRCGADPVPGKHYRCMQCGALFRT